VLGAVLALALGGCRQDMHDGPKVEPLEASAFFADGRGSRDPVPGTVARGQLNEDVVFFTGKDEGGQLASELPLPLDRGLLLRGRERYGIFCSPCHDQVGSGQGMIVRRGFKPPQTFHGDRLREVPIGHFFDVMTQGFGQMPSYRSQVRPADRWAIAAYIRALQLSQNAPVEVLPPEDRAALAEAAEEGRATGPSAPEHGAPDGGAGAAAGHGGGR